MIWRPPRETTPRLTGAWPTAISARRPISAGCWSRIPLTTPLAGSGTRTRSLCWPAPPASGLKFRTATPSCLSLERSARNPGEPACLPLAERFFAGGGNSHRGFGLNQAGPRDPIYRLSPGRHRPVHQQHRTSHAPADPAFLPGQHQFCDLPRCRQCLYQRDMTLPTACCAGRQKRS